MHGVIAGTGEGLRFSVSARDRLVQGTGECGLDEEAGLQAPDFVKVLQETGQRCDWTIVPIGGEEKVAAILRTVRTGSTRELRLKIGWPDPKFFRAEQLFEFVLSKGGIYSIYFPVPRLHRGFATEDEPYSYGDILSGRECALDVSGELPALGVSFPATGSSRS